MSKLSRITQKLFGSTAGTNQVAQFGSLAAGAPVYTTNPTTIQALANYLTGWFGAIEGANSPAIEDMNALHVLETYQLGYLMQEGVAEWDSATTYYSGSVVNGGGGVLYTSLQDNNINNAITNTSYWLAITNIQGSLTVVTNSGTTTLTYLNKGSVLFTGSQPEACLLPDTTTCKNGDTFTLFNKSTYSAPGSVQIKTSSSGLLTSISQGYGVTFTVIDNTVTAGWMQSGNNTETISSGWNAASSLASLTSYTIDSLILPPGNWQIFANADIEPSASNSPFATLQMSISTTAATLDANALITLSSAPAGDAYYGEMALNLTRNVTPTSNTQYYLVARAALITTWEYSASASNGGIGGFYAKRSS